MLRRKRERRNAVKENEMVIDTPLEKRRTPGKPRATREPPISVVITGHSKGSEDDLISFVWRKVKVRLMNISYSPASVTAVVKSQDFSRLNGLNGAAFAGDHLAIRRVDGASNVTQDYRKAKTKRSFRSVSAPSLSALATQAQRNVSKALPQSTNETIEKLRQFLQTRYQPATKFLDLGNLQQDPLLKQMGILAEASTKSKMFPALMKVASLNFPDVISVSLSDNNLQSVTAVTTLAQTWPKLLNLSLANNRITSLSDLDPWSPKTKLPELQELVLVGNPIVTTFANRAMDYQREMVSRFPKLRLLDGNSINSEIIASQSTVPFPVYQSFFDKVETEQIVNSFLAAFFKGWDENRSALVNQLYSPNATFSISLNASNVRTNFSQKTDTKKWGAYKMKSRNLLYSQSQKESKSRLFNGHEEISNAVKSLPATAHDLSDRSQWVFDGWNLVLPSVGAAIKIVVHGQFEEPQNKRLLRSFDRTLLILPGGSTGILIINDLLVIRSFAGSLGWLPGQSSVRTSNNTMSASASKPSDIVQPRPEQAMLDTRQQIVLKIKAETGLNDYYAHMCCEQNNWDYNSALASFLELKSRNVIPAEAFS
ncbi:mRNA export factor mex67 [Schizosaccharomyces pombe]